jgi:hypothetical protein
VSLIALADQTARVCYAQGTSTLLSVSRIAEKHARLAIPVLTAWLFDRPLQAPDPMRSLHYSRSEKDVLLDP